MPTAIVSGALANKHRNGGAAWTRLSWALGLRRLGFRVCFVEQIDPAACVDAAGAPAAFEGSENLAFFRRVTRRFGLADSAALVCGERVDGVPMPELLDRAADAEVLLNITGHLSLEPLRSRPRRKVYIDLDPGYTQIWHAEGVGGPRLEGHDFYFSVGENVGTAGCPIPTGGLRWRPVRQPVLLDDWPVCGTAEPDRFTTVASWRGPYGPVTQGGATLGPKAHEFRTLTGLPGRVPAATFEIALDIHPADAKDAEWLRGSGWRLADPKAVAGDPDTFRAYVQGSGAEFSVAQAVYVRTGSGWFSDRTVRYLASGKPVVVQDTGFGRNYPVGRGLLTFRTPDTAVASIEAVRADYEAHCRAARALAEQYFAAETVLGRLLEEIAAA
jgi:hypothetical protein